MKKKKLKILVGGLMALTLVISSKHAINIECASTDPGTLPPLKTIQPLSTDPGTLPPL